MPRLTTQSDGDVLKAPGTDAESGVERVARDLRPAEGESLQLLEGLLPSAPRHGSIHERLRRLRRRSGSTPQRITILGAGCAGLAAAYELKRLGHSVELLEASDRVGGRVRTWRLNESPNAPYGELGAMRIPASHTTTRYYIDALALSSKLRPFVTIFENQNALLERDGRISTLRDTFEQIGRGRDPARDTTERFVTVFKIVLDAIAPAGMLSAFERDLELGLRRRLERLELEPFLRGTGFVSTVRAFVRAHPRLRAHWHPALDLFFNDILEETGAGLLTLAGGMDQLPRALANALGESLRLNAQVRRIRVRAQGVELSWLERGRLETRLCDHVLCTIPFSVLRGIELSGLSQPKLESIRELPYCPATKVLIACRERFWEGPRYGIVGGASISAGAIRQVYYPSIAASGRRRARAPGVLTGSYTIGDDTRAFAGKSSEERRSLVLADLARLHPELLEPGMVLGGADMAWDEHPFSAGGCSVPWTLDAYADGPFEKLGVHEEHRQIAELRAYARRPEGRLFFAGEHCSQAPAWIEGAFDSALDAILELVTQ